MICTEEEAAQKWCPHSLLIFNQRDDNYRTHAVAGYNRAVDHSDQEALKEDRAGVHNNKLCNCIASRCMAWIPMPEKPNGKATKKAATKRGRCGFAQRFANEV